MAVLIDEVPFQHVDEVEAIAHQWHCGAKIGIGVHCLGEPILLLTAHLLTLVELGTKKIDLAVLVALLTLHRKMKADGRLLNNWKYCCPVKLK